ncbi:MULTISPECIES: class IIb bacteriocin, lactobin A/cerein 7B family [unclassified Janthinobacterium]|nr:MULTISPECIES: class IIb bacteriocin, lactobin A/cerein 7B family [unclassified Janthinobacterium]MDO8068888.1 class IIb bacteriocin, lactobin A/cerein 7B family [Janthinobacterium sp. SUN206]MDO8073649.1 class IIb bacteriocin, lactobin A/cerein 7B family [Janthinobacterium sp. SUN176]MED5615404.1 class IIb bacteriocin, lactobin A/cerein 7B family [Janthinobacterium sp. P210005]
MQEMNISEVEAVSGGLGPLAALAVVCVVFAVAKMILD